MARDILKIWNELLYVFFNLQNRLYLLKQFFHDQIKVLSVQFII